MRKTKLVTFFMLIMLLALSTSLMAQTVFDTENFDGLSDSDKIAENLTTYWDTWSSEPGGFEDGTVSTTQAYSSNNSMKIVNGNDQVLYFKSEQSAFSNGYFYYSHYMYVPTGKSGYFNLQAEFGDVWGVSVTVNPDGYSKVTYGLNSSLTIGSYVQADTWMHFEIEVDLENDSASFSIDATEVFNWTWSDCGSSELHVANYWGDYSDYEAYYDGIDFEAVPILSYSTDRFYESADNDGSITTTMTVTLENSEGIAFSGSNGTFNSSYYTTGNVPSGLNLEITRNSDTELQVNLTGNANNHTNNDDVSDLTISFLDAAFNGVIATDVKYSTKSDFIIDYIYDIGSLSDLRTLSENSSLWNERVLQTADIDASATSSWNSDGDGGYYGFSPIGEQNSNEFTGSYNGQNHTITNLYINRQSPDVGLFGQISGSTIENLGLIDVNFTADESYGRAGSLVGRSFNSSSISNCYSTGTITAVGGVNRVGGLVGYNQSSDIQNSFTNCSVTSSGDMVTLDVYVGGFVGYNWEATISNCYSTGDVTRSSGTETSFGGFCGVNDNDATIEYCYSTGSVFQSDGVTALSTANGFVSNDVSGTYTANFWDSDASNQTSGSGATGKTTDEMQTLSTFTDAGWDFEIETINGTNDYWDMDNSESINDGYPFLSWENGDDTALPVTLSTFNAIYNNEILTINWATESEENNAGWNIYRGTAEDALQNDAVIQINSELIAGEGTTNNITEYSYIDEHQVQAGETYWYWLEDVSGEGETEIHSPTSLSIPIGGSPEIPTEYGLHQNYPNPFNPNTNIRLALDYNSHIKLVIYNTKGQSVRTLADENVLGELFYEYSWNGMDDNGNKVSSGIYMYKLVTEQETFTKKMILMK